ncbi:MULTISPECIES: hypothetical protein [unclassified Dietzia]|uniref:hypothetical protein n=1 Tax=unclassified Dietzia TaxID=2617939 RepID=UPI0013196C36|nr:MULTISPECIES: hypothetical protein [unclassified Dietzia]MBB1024412.1 hypothetical protein [Dietzia sp. DQ12-76]MBB1027130.1 hypothetical protein [Dietzia sp. DQ11-38-2]QGW23172.1 hypothetical protein GJR88_00170 [Dietzia sp. DQ12-45-1b]
MSYGWDDGSDGPRERWGQQGYRPEPRRSVSGAVIALVAILAVLGLVLLGALAYLLLRPGGMTGETSGRALTTSSTSSTPLSDSALPPVTETAYATPTERETVTVTRPAPGARAPQGSSGYPTGADASGWTDNRQARCNAGDPAVMIGRTTQAAFSICVNPDNGRYYYRGSSGGAGVEVDDPVVAGGYAWVSNNDVVYSIDAGGMEIYEGGVLLSSQPMVEFWAG